MKHPAALSCEHGINSLRDRFPAVRCLWNHRRHKLTQILMEARELLSLYCLTAYWPQRHRTAHSLLSRLSKLSKAVILSLICLSRSSPPCALSFCHCGVCYLLHSCRELLKRLAWRILSVDAPHIVCPHVSLQSQADSCVFCVSVCWTNLF